MRSKRKGRPSEVWTDDQRRRLSKLMKEKHKQKVGELQETKPQDELTPEELAELKAEDRAKQAAASSFAYDFRQLTFRSPPAPAAEALFRACGIDDVDAMREVAKWIFIMSCYDLDGMAEQIELEIANRVSTQLEEERR